MKSNRTLTHAASSESSRLEAGIAGNLSDSADHVLQPTVVESGCRLTPEGVESVGETVSFNQAMAVSDTPGFDELSAHVRLPESPPGYQVLRKLGGGGMGDVFLARELSSERVVAMKFLRESSNPTAIERFLTEVRALGRLDHPNIIKILATDFYRAVPYFTMEFAQGRSLSDQIVEAGPLEPPKAARVMAAVAWAVEAAHAVGVLHRDLKPSNILLSADGAPKVADFGLAKRTDRDEDLTLTNTPLGTPGFMPPEQFSRRHGEPSAASDVYGLGATLYYLLSGQRPGSGATPSLSPVETESGSVHRLRALRREIPVELEAIVMKCLEPAPPDRYPSARTLAEDLERFLAGKSPRAPRLTHWRRLRRWASSQRRYLAGAAAAIAVMGGLAIYWPKRIVELSAPVDLRLDPVEMIQRELRAGHSVQIIGETGPPVYHRWRLGGGGFGESVSGDKTCYYECMEFALLELIPDPGIDRYRVIFELRHLGTRNDKGTKSDRKTISEDADEPGAGTRSDKGTKSDRPVNGADHSYLAPYFGHCEIIASENTVHSLFAFTYSDIHPNGAPTAGMNLVRPRAAALSLRPNADPTLSQLQLAPLYFKSDNKQFGPWRTFRIDVKPEGISAFWKSDDGEFQPLLNASREKLREQSRIIQARLNKKPPGLTIPDWSPRTPLGVWSFAAAVSIRNVSISPLPAESEGK